MHKTRKAILWTCFDFSHQASTNCAYLTSYYAWAEKKCKALFKSGIKNEELGIGGPAVGIINAECKMQSAKHKAWDDSLQLPVARASREIKNSKYKIQNFGTALQL